LFHFKRIGLILGPALLVAALAARAATLADVEVEYENDRYRLTSTTYFDAPPSALYRVLTNYDLFTKISSTFAEARNLEPDEQGRPRFFTRMDGCIIMFCVSFDRYGHLELQPEHDIVAIVDPELSDFKYSRERWQLLPDGDGTLLLYEFEMEPDFWVPPVVGPFVIKRALSSGGKRAVNRIEALALGREPEP